MKHRTTAALVRGILLVLVGAGLLALTRALGESASASEARRGIVGNGRIQPEPEPHLRLIVGDTVRIALVRVGAGNPFITVAVESIEAIPAGFVTSASDVAQVRGASLLVARGPGRATVRATQPDGSPRPDKEFIIVEVITRQRATNEVIVEVCPNRDEREILEEEPFTGDVVSIHEYHDCQKLISGTSYVTVAGIFSPHDLALAQARAHFETGRLVAMLVNFGTRQDTATYRPLGLRPGTSCLYLRALAPTRWQAYLVGQRSAFIGPSGGREYGSCNPAMNWREVVAAGRSLDVHHYDGVDMKGDSIAPAVARWDWDSTNAQNYIGVKCGKATWCEIGPIGFRRRAPLTFTDTTTRPVTLRPILKGYYDEQYLANATGTMPTRVFGTITPDRDAHSHGAMQHAVSRWYQVARLAFRNDSRGVDPEYARYVRAYTNSPPPSPRRTSISLGLHPMESPLGQNKHAVYSGRLGSRALPPDAIMYRYHVPHGGTPTPTARWRWVETDEKTWSYCDPEGCCEIQKTFTM